MLIIINTLASRLPLAQHSMAASSVAMALECKRVFMKGITSSRGQMIIGRAASAGALEPEPAVRHRGLEGLRASGM